MMWLIPYSAVILIIALSPWWFISIIDKHRKNNTPYNENTSNKE